MNGLVIPYKALHKTGDYTHDVNVDNLMMLLRKFVPEVIGPIEGPEIWWVCPTCDEGGHRCHFCGNFLTHSEYHSWNGHNHYRACRPDLFDEEGNYLHDQ